MYAIIRNKDTRIIGLEYTKKSAILFAKHLQKDNKRQHFSVFPIVKLVLFNESAFNTEEVT